MSSKFGRWKLANVNNRCTFTLCIKQIDSNRPTCDLAPWKLDLSWAKKLIFLHTKVDEIVDAPRRWKSVEFRIAREKFKSVAFFCCWLAQSCLCVFFDEIQFDIEKLSIEIRGICGLCSRKCPAADEDRKFVESHKGRGWNFTEKVQFSFDRNSLIFFSTKS